MRPPLLDESEFIRVYRELTGGSEAQARSVFMFACCLEDACRNGDHAPGFMTRNDPAWEKELLHEPVTEPRSLSHLHQLPGQAGERFA